MKNFTNDTRVYELSRYLNTKYTTLSTENNLVSLLESTQATNFFDLIGVSTRKFVNDLIMKYYPNEIMIKATFIKQVLLKSNNHITVFELNSGESRLDLCKVNGNSIAFEIKTELDTLNRLPKQLNDYMDLYDLVYVICPHYRINEVIKIIPSECGIYSYTHLKNGKYVFRKYKAAIKNKELNSLKQLNLMTKSYLKNLANYNLVLDKRGYVELLMKQLSSKKINTLYKTYIKNKYGSNWEFLKTNIENIYEIDYQWFFKNNISPNNIYKKES